MPGFFSGIETALGKLLTSQRGRDAKLLTRLLPSTKSTGPSITVISSTLGASIARLGREHTPLGQNLFPDLSWSLAPTIDAREVKSYLLIVEDADAPLPSPVVHGLYYDIPANRTAVRAGDFEVANDDEHDATAAERKKRKGKGRGSREGRQQGRYRWGVSEAGRAGAGWSGVGPNLCWVMGSVLLPGGGAEGQRAGAGRWCVAEQGGIVAFGGFGGQGPCLGGIGSAHSRDTAPTQKSGYTKALKRESRKRVF